MNNEPANGERWMARRNCTQSEAELFFIDPPRHGRGPSDRDAEAKRICGGCVVRTECLTYALENDVQHGVWGGLGERERAALVESGAA